MSRTAFCNRNSHANRYNRFFRMLFFRRQIAAKSFAALISEKYVASREQSQPPIEGFPLP
jgi:hypothetical protein